MLVWLRVFCFGVLVEGGGEEPNVHAGGHGVFHGGGGHRVECEEERGQDGEEESEVGGDFEDGDHARRIGALC